MMIKMILAILLTIILLGFSIFYGSLITELPKFECKYTHIRDFKESDSSFKTALGNMSIEILSISNGYIIFKKIDDTDQNIEFSGFISKKMIHGVYSRDSIINPKKKFTGMLGINRISGKFYELFYLDGVDPHIIFRGNCEQTYD